MKKSSETLGGASEKSTPSGYEDLGKVVPFAGDKAEKPAVREGREKYLKNVNNLPEENEAVQAHLESAKDRIIGDLRDQAMHQSFAKLNNPEASAAEVARNADMSEVLRAEVYMGVALDVAEMYAEVTGGSICDGMRKQIASCERRMQKADQNDAIQRGAWSDAKMWSENLLGQMASYRGQQDSGNALPSDVL